MSLRRGASVLHCMQRALSSRWRVVFSSARSRSGVRRLRQRSKRPKPHCRSRVVRRCIGHRTRRGREWTWRMRPASELPDDRALPGLVAIRAIGLATLLPALGLDGGSSELLLRGYTEGSCATLEVQDGRRRLAVKAY